MSKKGLVGAIVSGVVLVLVIILAIICCERIPAGYVGVVYNMNGGVSGELLTQGFHIIAPTKKITTYSIGIEQSYLTATDKGDSEADESFNVPTSDGKTVKVDLEFSYKFDIDRVADTFVKFKGRSGNEIKDTFIKPKIMAWTQEVTANFPVTDIFGDKRTAINTELDKYLKTKFEPYGIIIDTVNFTDISVDKATEKAIQEKVTAQQKNELAKIEAETAIVNANKDKEVAEIDAQKILIAANAQAEANKVIANSLSDTLIEKQKLEKWDGKLPQITSDSTVIKDFAPNAK